jgi:probable F420-dependent oxidoreductase
MGTGTAEATTALKERLTAFGVWTGSMQWPTDLGAAGDAAAELEQLGFGAVWIGLSSDLSLHEALLAATSTLVVATAILDVWTNPAGPVAARHHQLTTAYPGRFVLGLGSGHAQFVEPATGQRYTKPVSKLASYLDELDAAKVPVPGGERVLAALGPRALQLAADRSAGAHPYLMTAEHTADARTLLGADALLAPEQKVFVGADREEARRVARRSLAIYLGLPNYLRALRSYGFDDADFAGQGSDRFVDGTVAWGDGDAVRRRVQDHLDAGADHVTLQVLRPGDPGTLPLTEWRAVAELLIA